MWGELIFRRTDASACISIQQIDSFHIVFHFKLSCFTIIFPNGEHPNNVYLAYKQYNHLPVV